VPLAFAAGGAGLDWGGGGRAVAEEGVEAEDLLRASLAELSELILC
jgi:hypothetical protein